MAVVGEAHIVVRAITNQVKDDIRRGFDGSDREGQRAGQKAGDGYQRGFKRGLGRGGGGGMFSNLRQEALQAADSFGRLVQAGYALGPAIVAIVGAIGGAVGGLFALGAQAAAAGPALLSLVNVFGALAQGAATLKMVFSGVGAAIGAAGKSAGGGGRSAKAAAKAIEAAKDRLKNARKRLAQVIDSANRQEEAALEKIEQAEKRVEDARENHTEAINREAEAQERATEAAEAVTEARDEARESIQQLRFELEDAVLSEQRAALNLEDARNELARVANLPPNNRQRREAELAFAEAELRLRRAKDTTNDTAAEVDEANQKGIEGSDEVVAALKRQEDAEEAHNEAKKDTQRALEAIEEAQEGVRDATNDYNELLVKNRARIKEAEEAVKKAKEALDEAKKGGDGAGGGVDKFAEAMSKLAPAAQEFVKFAVEVKKEFGGIKKAAQQEFFSKINDDIFELTENYLPILEERLPKTAGVLAGVGEKIIGVFNLPDNQNRIDRVLGSNDIILGNLGEAVANLANSFIILLDNLRPLAEEFSEWVLTLTEGWNNALIANDETGELSSTLDYAGGVAKTLGRIFGNLFDAIGKIGGAAAGPGSGGEKLLKLFEHLTWKWKEFTGSVEGQQRLEDFFNNIVPLASELGGLIGDIIKAFFTTAEQGTSQEGGGPLTPFITSLREVVRILSEEMGPQLLNALPIIGKGFEDAATAMANLTSSGAIEVFFQLLADFAEVVKNVTGNQTFQKIFSIAAPIFAASRALGLVAKLLRFIFLGALLGPIFKFIGMFKTLRGMFWQIRAAIQTIGLFFGVGSGPVLLFAAAIAGLIAIFVAMWNESEIFREAIKKLIDGVIQKAIDIFERLKGKLEEALKPLGGTSGVVDKLKTAFKFLGDIIGKYIIPFFEAGLKNALDIIVAPIEFVIELVGNLFGAFDKIFTGIKEGDVGKIFEGIVEAITAPFRALWDTLVQLVTSIFDNVVQAVKDVLGIASPSSVFADIGQSVIDGIINIITFLPEKFLEIFTAAWDAVSEYFTETVLPWLKELPGKFLEALKGLWDAFIDLLDIAWDLLKAYFTTTGKIYLFIFGLPGKFGTWLRGLWDSFYDYLFGDEGIWSKVKGAFEPGGTIYNWLGGLYQKIKNAASGMWDGLKEAFFDSLRAIVKAWNNFRFSVKIPTNAATTALRIAGWGFVLDTPDFTPSWLAEGGIVPATRGGFPAMLAEAGRPERVEPLDENGLSKRDKAMIDYLSGGLGGGTTINVYPSEGMDERELAEKVSRELAFMMRRGTL